MWVMDEFEQSAARHPDRPFIHVPERAARGYAEGPIEFSYRQARARVDELKARYASKGYGLGHRLALMLDNRAEFFLHLLALNALGVSVVPVHGELSGKDLEFLISHSGAAAVLALDDYLARVRAAAGTVPVVRDPTELPRPANPAADGVPDAATEAAMVYTSGTTGQPKGCMLSNAYFVGFGSWYQNLGGACALEPGAERLITPLPVNHMNALACSFMAMLATGGCLVQLDRFHPSAWWATVRESEATIIHYLGVMPAMLLGAAPRADDDLSGQVKFGFGAGVDPRHHGAFEERFGFPLVEAWAMTETGCGAALVANHEPRHVGARCIGRATPELQYRLIDEQGAEVVAGTPGELLVRHAGPDPRRFFFSGYYRDEAATEAAWAGGWFHTGDVVRQGSDGSFYFVDRRKNIIRRSGENIAAVEVEGVLLNHPAVAQCAVAPVPDEIRGEEVMALIQLNPATAADRRTATEIFAFARRALAYYKAPGYVAFVGALPVTSSQKIRRGEVKRLAAQRLDEGDCFDLRDHKRRPRLAEAE